MEYQIHGTTMQTLQLQLNAGEAVFSEAGALLYMTPNVEMDSRATKGGIGRMFSRMMSGNSVFLNYLTAHDGSAEVAFATRMPGHILPLDLRQFERVIVERHAFLCAEDGTDFGVESVINVRGFFGGMGIFYNYLKGDHMAFVSIDGEVIERQLAPGERLLVHHSHIAAYESSVGFELKMLKGFKNVFFSGDGAYMVELTGPGHIWLHGLTAHGLAELLMQYLPQGNR